MSFTFAEEPNKASVQKMMDGFQAATKVSVEPQGYAWGDMQKNILLRVRSNTAPDVAQLSERWLPNYAATKGVVDFNDVFGKDQLASILAPAALAMGQVNGKQLGIPLMTGSIGMIANKEVLAKAGVDKMPVTIDEFKAALVAVRDKVPNSVPYAMATKNNNSIILDYMLWTWAYGGQIIDSEGNVKVGASPAGKQALAFMAGLVKDRLAAPEIDRPDSRRLLGQGVSAFYFDAPQARGFIRNFSGRGEAMDAAITPVKTPVAKAGDTPRSIEWGHVLIAFAPDGKMSKDAPAAKWLAYIMSDAVQTDFTLGQSALPVSKSARRIGCREEGRFPRRLGRRRRRTAAQRDRRVEQRSRADQHRRRGSPGRDARAEDRRRGCRGDAEAPRSRNGEPEEGRLIGRPCSGLHLPAQAEIKAKSRDLSTSPDGRKIPGQARDDSGWPSITPARKIRSPRCHTPPPCPTPQPMHRAPRCAFRRTRIGAG